MSAPIQQTIPAGEIPFSEYAAVYDLVYQDKNYAAEAAFVAELVKRYLGESLRPARILDLACGTGRHACELARLGFAVEGSDISERMIQIARHSAQELGIAVQFHHESFQTCQRIGTRFDAAVAMFASLGYLTSWDDFALAFSNVSSLLAPGGVFVFDVWNGTAVLRDLSPHKVKRATGKGRTVERVSRTTIDELRQVADVRFDFVVTADDGVSTRFEERHQVRYFFPQELCDMMRALGFTVLLRCPFMEPDRELRPGDWNATYVVRSDI